VGTSALSARPLSDPSLPPPSERTEAGSASDECSPWKISGLADSACVTPWSVRARRADLVDDDGCAAAG
jgi:hypothetical protein